VKKTSKVYIDGHVFETSKAKWHASLDHFDGNNNIYGDVYESTTGIFYVFTPSQWSNRHSWEINEPSEIIAQYGSMLSDEAAEYLIKRGNIKVE
jgi:kynurenine formamidase